MGRATGYRPPAPKKQPEIGPDGKPVKPCAECEKSQCKNGYRTSIQDYACWCGGDTAPARSAGLEGQIPADEGQWDKWVADNGLPKPYDGVDRCCMIHDLELGKLRQSDPSLAYDSPDPRAAAINSRLAKCFNKEKNNMNNKFAGRFFARNGETYFNYKAANQLPGQSMTGALATDGADVGFGGIGAGSAATGATYAFGA